MSDNDAPTLPAFYTDNQYHVWCTYCRCWHHHGRAPGHRVAHCYTDDSPYRATGYILEEAGPWLSIARARRRHARGEAA